MGQRFFVKSRILGDSAQLDGPQSHHLAHVMRARVGDEVTLFDGFGGEYLAAVQAIGRDAVRLRILQRLTVERESAVSLELAVPLPKGDRARWLVEKATELGVERLVPLTTCRQSGHMSGALLSRLRRTVIEACKQCGRNRLMQITDPVAWKVYAGGQGTSGDEAAICKLVAHPAEAAESLAPVLAELTRSIDRGTVSRPLIRCAFGPEGGFTPEELAEAQETGWNMVRLGGADTED